MLTWVQPPFRQAVFCTNRFGLFQPLVDWLKDLFDINGDQLWWKLAGLVGLKLTLKIPII